MPKIALTLLLFSTLPFIVRGQDSQRFNGAKQEPSAGPGLAHDSLSLLNPEMVRVDSGSFIMGCMVPNDVSMEDECGPAENPAHRVTLSGFSIMKYEVTQAMWRLVMGAGPSWHKDCADCPVEMVSWDEVQEFIGRLNERTGRHYVLPTEAQWEYAARGGPRSKGYKFSGSDDIVAVAWWGDKVISTRPVGTRQPNELGICDMSGNVWEWCSDWYGDYTGAAQTNPEGPVSGVSRVMRGGSTRHEDEKAIPVARVWTRGHALPDERRNDVGFRLVLAP